ncbi:hypothetical protein PsorP6_014486 [Peronosclerospora sorghi]|uniref:Uncharacterized protein n=1 Tax=Peronosclerospora sorghi TaxID=230839 RepID=A0ACC0VR83_9STRA|nr:hypothetical protein PsorP6_014486 [Peronosclerospora sorghi]
MSLPLPYLNDPTTLRCFLHTQTCESICCDIIPKVLPTLRHFPVLAHQKKVHPAVPLDHIGDFLDVILMAQADGLLLQNNTHSCMENHDDLPLVTKDAFFERYKPKSSTQVLCGYLFQRNDIVFNCKTCQSDETCVLCLKCFQNGNHEGHEVFFHRTSPGGVCDCGDSEAWAPEGFCVYHGQDKENGSTATNRDNAESLPPEMLQVADALFTVIVNFCVDMAKRSVQIFDPEVVDSQGRDSLRDLWSKIREHRYSVDDAQVLERQFHVRICNDDVHSDEDLIRSLKQKRIARAEDLVRAIDSNGSEIVARNISLRDALTLMQALKNEGWHVCVVHDTFIHDEDVFLRVTRWVKAICSLSKQLHALFCNKLFVTNDQSKEPIQVMFLSDPYFRKDVVLELYELYLKLQGDKDTKLQFSIVFLKVYDRMMRRYFCGVGTREESLFQYGVQILTTPSIVHHLASMDLLNILLDAINTALEMARARTVGSHLPQGVHDILDCDHPLLKFKRYHFVLENLGYVLGIPAMSNALLLKFELLEKWLSALAEIHGLGPQVRIQDGCAHVTYENQSWLTAFALHANVSKIITIISRSLRYPEAGDTESRDQERERMISNMLEGFWNQLNQSGVARMQLYVSPHESLSSGSDEEKLVGLLEDALLGLIWIVTELAPPLDAIEQQDTVLRREIIHRLSQNSCKLSDLLEQTTFVMSTPCGNISARQENQHLARLERILDEVADEQSKRSGDGFDDDSMGDGGMEPTKYILKKAYFKEYDPSFYHLSRSSHEKAQFTRHEALFKTWKVEDPPIPLVAQLPPAHYSLISVRYLVLEKGLLGVMRLVLDDVNSRITGHFDGMDCKSGPNRTNAMVVVRIMHLINLVVLVLKQGSASFDVLQSNDNVGFETRRRETLVLLRSGPDAFEEAIATCRGIKRVKRQPTVLEDSDMPLTSDQDQSNGDEVKELSVVALLVALAKDMIQRDFETSKSTISAIYWILNELAALDRVIHAYVEGKVWSGVKKNEALVTQHGMSKAQLKEFHQQRAIAAMIARQKAFAQSGAFIEMDNEDMEDEECGGSGRGAISSSNTNDPSQEIPGDTIVYRPPPPPNCIICSQKEKDEPIMYIGHAQMSRVIEHARKNLPGDVITTAGAYENQNGESNTTSFAAAAVFPPQIHLSLCGHAVHLHCWQKYFESVKAQSRFNLEHSQTSIAFDAHFGEFLCPLCQTLSSMLVPCLPVCSPLTLTEQQRGRDAMERVFQSKQDTSILLSWLTNGLPNRLEALSLQGEEDVRDDADDKDGRSRQRQDNIRAMNQFAISSLEAMLRFQPEMTHVTNAMSTLKKGFFSTGPQLTHLIWSSVASTITSTQLSGISAAVFSQEMYAFSSKNGRKSGNWRPNLSHRSSSSTGPATTMSSLSSLRITNILNPAVPCLKTRLAVSLPEALDPQLDQCTPKDDSKLNVLLRSLRHIPLLFANHHRDFYSIMCFPIAQNLRLALSPEQWAQVLPQGPPLQFGLPILSQDLFYLTVAICSSMLTTKADIVLTIRSFCVLYMAQVLIQIAQLEAEDEEDCRAEEPDEATRSIMAEDENSPEHLDEMQRGLEGLMKRLAEEAGVNVVATSTPKGDEVDATTFSSRRPAPTGRQLELLFKSSCLAFMRQVTLFCRASFRGEQDPNASWSANFVSSLRLSTNYHGMCEQLGLPRITQLLADEALVNYLLQAARELRDRPTSAALPQEVQLRYKQHGDADPLVVELEKLSAGEKSSPERARLVIKSNLREVPKLPLRQEPDAQQDNGLFHFATIRLVKLAASYTDLHSQVLGKSKCQQTSKTVENPALCLICEQVLCAGTECCRRRSDGMGACTYHAITCGAGVGLFFLLRSSSVLLVYGPRSSYFGSPYLDMFGEEDINVRRGRPLYLSAKRMKALQALYATHQVANEVARNRRTSDQYIRNNYY